MGHIQKKFTVGGCTVFFILQKKLIYSQQDESIMHLYLLIYENNKITIQIIIVIMLAAIPTFFPVSLQAWASFAAHWLLGSSSTGHLHFQVTLQVFIYLFI